MDTSKFITSSAEIGHSIAFELKTEKKIQRSIQRLRSGRPSIICSGLRSALKLAQGLLVVGPPGACMSDASPPDELYLVETAVLVNLMRALAAKIGALWSFLH